MNKDKEEIGENADYLFPEIDNLDFEAELSEAFKELEANYSDDQELVEKAVSTESVSEAKKRGLVPQSGDWGKPKRWVRPEDADVPVDEGKKPRKPATAKGQMRDSTDPSTSEDLIISPETKAGIKGVFGDDFEISDLQDMYSIGLDGYTTNILTLRGRVIRNRHGLSGHDFSQFNIEAQIHDEDGRDAGRMDRTFSRDENGRLKVYLNSFVIKNRYHGKGIASDINEHVEEEYEKFGVHEITLNANATVGGYAWASQGYDFRNDKEKTRIQMLFKTFVTKMHENGKISEDLEPLLETLDSFNHSWEFASWNPLNESHGEHLGKKILLGRSWDAQKILDKKSPGYQIGKAYFAAKRNTSVRG